ncbi:MAG TPA: hypothetical protein DIS66_04475 [Candidatus Omnitrophica bacterium]|nr:hypothetical protein [Candidatus Omnitrophota bacterium]
MTEAWKLTVEDGIGVLTMDHPDSEVNVLTSVHLEQLDKQLDGLKTRTDLRALLFASAKKKIFIAGADINEIAKISTPDDAFQAAERGKVVFQKIEDLPYATICVINGACLGGGFELALSCWYRVASFSDSVKIGLPEVNLGILPGFGGSIRLPKLIGLLKSLPLILGGSIVGAQDAFKKGLVDKLFYEQTLLQDAIQYAKVLGGIHHPERKQSLQDKLLEGTSFGRDFVFSQARKDVLKKTKGFYPAPLEIIKLIQSTYGKTGAQVYKEESHAFSKLGATAVSKACIRVFFLSERYKKRPWGKSEKPASFDAKKVGVIGAGVMGGGIAHLVSSKNIPVRVKDIDTKALGGALKEAYGLFKASLKRRKLKPHDMTRQMNLISTGLTYDGIKNADVVIEAVVENLDIKKKVFKELASVVGQNTILASNTSSLPVTQMAAGCENPSRVVGLHFFNPVNRMPLVEVIRAEQTSDETLDKTIAFSRKLGKTVIVTEDKPGFLVNRLLLPYLNEAALLMEEGLDPEAIDRIATQFGMPMGPVELVDQVGIDVGYKVAHILQDAFGERMKVASILESAYQKKLLGKKGGKGFYLYDKDKKYRNPEIPFTAKSGISDEIALKRMMYIMVNEAARCLEEKVIDSAETVDVGMIFGTGFPPFRGGLMDYADTVGLASIVEDLQAFEKQYGSRFVPCKLLTDLASQNNKFRS